jgi:hypothetical protein
MARIFVDENKFKIELQNKSENLESSQSHT